MQAIQVGFEQTAALAPELSRFSGCASRMRANELEFLRRQEAFHRFVPVDRQFIDPRGGHREASWSAQAAIQNGCRNGQTNQEPYNDE
jgi:hypothetical protein